MLAAVVPFGRILASDIHPAPPGVRFAEGLVLAFLAGWCWHRLRHRPPAAVRLPGSTAALLFAAVIAGSALVGLGALRPWKDYWWPYLGTLAVYFGRDYLTIEIDPRPWIGGVNGLLAPQAAALLLEGLALARAVQVSCSGHGTLWRRLVTVSAVAATGTAAVSVGTALTGSIASSGDALDFLSVGRFAIHTSKVNTAASSFAMFLPIAGALLWSGPPGAAAGSRWPRLLRLLALTAASLTLLAALWMTGSRAGLIAAIVAAAALLAIAIATTTRSGDLRRIGIVSAAGVAVIALVTTALLQRSQGSTQAWPIATSLNSRAAMWQNTVGMILDHPFTGVGVGQFSSAIMPYFSEDERTAFAGKGRFNAHNQFLQITAELGLVGGALFVTMLAGILWTAWGRCRRDGDLLLGGVIAGLGAFLLSSMAGQPLQVEVVAFPFWMVLGAAAGAGPERPAYVSTGCRMYS